MSKKDKLNKIEGMLKGAFFFILGLVVSIMIAIFNIIAELGSNYNNVNIFKSVIYALVILILGVLLGIIYKKWNYIIDEIEKEE